MSLVTIMLEACFQARCTDRVCECAHVIGARVGRGLAIERGCGLGAERKRARSCLFHDRRPLRDAYNFLNKIRYLRTLRIDGAGLGEYLACALHADALRQTPRA